MMGYYTRHELEVLGDTIGGDVGYHSHAITEASGYSNIFEGEEIKWYKHREEMKTYSKKYPDLIFKLSGEGEESGDIWNEYYQDGKMQFCKAKIVFDEFDASKLA